MVTQKKGGKQGCSLNTYVEYLRDESRRLVRGRLSVPRLIVSVELSQTRSVGTYVRSCGNLLPTVRRLSCLEGLLYFYVTLSYFPTFSVSRVDVQPVSFVTGFPVCAPTQMIVDRRIHTYFSL